MKYSIAEQAHIVWASARYGREAARVRNYSLAVDLARLLRDVAQGTPYNSMKVIASDAARDINQMLNNQQRRLA